MSDRLAEIKERLAISKRMNAISEQDESMSDWYERDVGYLAEEVKRLRAERPNEKTVRGWIEEQCATDHIHTPLVRDAITQFARRAGLIE